MERKYPKSILVMTQAIRFLGATSCLFGLWLGLLLGGPLLVSTIALLIVYL